MTLNVYLPTELILYYTNVSNVKPIKCWTQTYKCDMSVLHFLVCQFLCDISKPIIIIIRFLKRYTLYNLFRCESAVQVFDGDM